MVLDLAQRNKKVVIGYREHQAGFDWLIDSQKMKSLPKTVIAEPASLDEIVLRFNMEGKK